MTPKLKDIKVDLILDVGQGLMEVEKPHFTGVVQRPKGFSGNSDTIVWYVKNGSPFRLDGPAVMTFDKNGNCTDEQYWLDGAKYSKEAWEKKKLEQQKSKFEKFDELEPDLRLGYADPIPPDFTGTILIKYSDGYVFYHYKNGNAHNESGPAKIKFDLDGDLKNEKYYLGGRFYDTKENWEKCKQTMLAAPKFDELEPDLRIDYNGKVPNKFTGTALIKFSDAYVFSYFKDGLMHNESGAARLRFGLANKNHAFMDQEYYLDGQWIQNEENWKKAMAKKVPETQPTFPKSKPNLSEVAKEMWDLRGPYLEALDKLVKCRTGIGTGNAGFVTYSKDFSGVASLTRDNGTVVYNHVLKGKLHNQNGPAVIEIDKDSIVLRAENWYDGCKQLGCEVDVYQFVAYMKWLIDVAAGRSTNTNTKAEKQMANKIVTTVKSDASKTAYRMAANKTVKMARGFLVETMTTKMGHKGAAKRNAAAKLEEFFASPYGDAAISLLIGSLLPLVQDKIPANHAKKVAVLAEEFRVRGMTVVGDEFVEMLTGPLAGMLMGGLKDVFGSLDEPEAVRVDVGSDALAEQMENEGSGVIPMNRAATR